MAITHGKLLFYKWYAHIMYRVKHDGNIEGWHNTPQARKILRIYLIWYHVILIS